MTKPTDDGRISRRGFVRLGLTGLAAIPVASVLSARTAAAGDMPKLDEADPAAAALGYKHDATQVDTAKFPKRAGEEGAKQLCSNCALYQAGAEDGWGGCGIFPGKLVAGDGWCNAWAPKG